MNHRHLSGTAAVLLALCGAAHAQSSVTVYGSIDQYLNYMKSNSGTSLKGLEDGALLRTRIGFRGIEDLGDGLQAKFTLEQGIYANSGTTADSSRGWDRQAWVGLAGSAGEVRFGRQNGPIFFRGGYIDFTSRTLGSMVNNFGVPSRFDNDISYLSPRVAGLQFEGHIALGETPAGLTAQAVYQGAVDYLYGPFRVGYAGLRGKPPSGAPYGTQVAYDNVYANYDYGRGRVYLTYVRSNNNTAGAAGRTAGTILGNVGGLVAGTNPDVNNYFRILQASVDYLVTPALRIGALWGTITDQSGNSRGASGGAVGAYYSLSKRTTLYSLVDTLRNQTNGSFRPSGSSALPLNFTAPSDVQGHTINGVQLGIQHSF
ncbi:MAG: porin [Burkholderiales bacterium]|nr:porin [Burkholderiales bacterium]